MGEKLKSRKLWAAVIASALSIFFPQYADKITTLAMTYIGGQAVVDAASALKK